MKTFTIRDLDRTPRKVLDCSLREGRAVVRARSGEAFLITPLPEGEDSLPDEELGQRWLEDHRKWRNSQPRKQAPTSQVADVDRLIAGE